MNNNIDIFIVNLKTVKNIYNQYWNYVSRISYCTKNSLFRHNISISNSHNLSGQAGSRWDEAPKWPVIYMGASWPNLLYHYRVWLKSIWYIYVVEMEKTIESYLWIIHRVHSTFGITLRKNLPPTSICPQQSHIVSLRCELKTPEWKISLIYIILAERPIVAGRLVPQKKIN